MMLIATSVSAQQSQPAAETSTKDMPAQAQQLTLAGDLVRYGYQTKSALPLIQAVQIYKSLGVSAGTEQKKEEGSPVASTLQKGQEVQFDEAQLLADATKFAEGNKNILALIKDAEKSTRGAAGGPVRRVSSVNAGYTDTWTIRFRGGEAAYVVVSGDGDTDLDLYVYDENGNFITSDTDYSDDCVVSFTPRWTGVFYIKIVNRGRVYNRYVLATN